MLNAMQYVSQQLQVCHGDHCAQNNIACKNILSHKHRQTYNNFMGQSLVEVMLKLQEHFVMNNRVVCLIIYSPSLGTETK